MQDHAHPRGGTISYYWFDNEHIGLRRTRFHRIHVPFEPFDTGCDYIEQPEAPELTVEWIKLDIENPALLAGVDLYSTYHEDMEASIYIGAAHNPVTITSMHLKEVAVDRYEIDASIEIDFEYEGVAEREEFNFTFLVQYVGEA